MKNKILWIISILPTLITAIALRFMPAEVPMHYDASGTIDRWGSKYENYIFPAIIIVNAIFWVLFIRHYKKKSMDEKLDDKIRTEAKNNAKVIYYVAVGMSAMFTVMQCVFLYMAFREAKDNLSSMKLDVNTITNVMMGIFLIFIGNIVPKAKMNGTVGVRTVWSTENDKVWAASNKYCGIIMMIAGVITIIEAVVIGGFSSTMVMLGIIIVASILSVFGSYKAYMKYK